MRCKGCVPKSTLGKKVQNDTSIVGPIKRETDIAAFRDALCTLYYSRHFTAMGMLCIHSFKEPNRKDNKKRGVTMQLVEKSPLLLFWHDSSQGIETAQQQ